MWPEKLVAEVWQNFTKSGRKVAELNFQLKRHFTKLGVISVIYFLEHLIGCRPSHTMAMLKGGGGGGDDMSIERRWAKLLW